MAVKKNTKAAPALPQVSAEYGKVPPQAIEIEEVVLGAIMLEKDALIKVLDILQTESFYKDAHQKIYSAILDLYTGQQAIDIVTVTEKLKKKGELEEIGGPFYITQLTSRVASAAHIEYHARIIAQKYIQRELIRVASEIQNRAFDDSTDVLDLLNFSEEELFKITQGSIKKETEKIDVLIDRAIKRIEDLSKREDSLSGIPSGFTQLDRITSGWQNSDLIIVAGRPSMGKTAFALTMARNMAIDHKKPVAVFSLEMSSLQLVNRLIVSETELSSSKIKNGKLENYEWEQLDYKIKKLINAPVFIDDTPAISLFEFRAKSRRLKSQENIELIIVDYLQLMTTGMENRGNREQEVSLISRSLKSIAKELDIPIIALSQLRRPQAGDKVKQPYLSDLRESGAIEQDADIVMFIHRPEMIGITADEEGNSTIGLAEIIIAKHRNGQTGEIPPLNFKSEFAKFVEYDENFSDNIMNNGNGITRSSKMNKEKSVANATDNLDDDKGINTVSDKEGEPF